MSALKLSRVAATVRALLRQLPRGERPPEIVWAGRHAVLVRLLWLQTAGLVIASIVVDSAACALINVLSLLVLAGFAATPTQSRQVRTVACSAGLIACSVVLVQLTHGQPISYYHFFVMLAVIALYQEWEPFLIAVGFTLVHHLLVGLFLPLESSAGSFAEQHRVGWTLISLGFVVAVCAAYLYAWRLAEDQRNLSEQVLGAGDGVYGVDGRGRIRFVNEAAMRLIGARDPELAKDAVLGRDQHIVFGHADEYGQQYQPDECPICAVIDAASGEHASGAGFTRLDYARSFPVEYVSTHSPGRGGGNVVAFRDVSDRVALQDELTRLALHDQTTGLPNRASLTVRLEAAVARLSRRPEPIAVLFCDLDRFKAVNDTYGHAAGDELLRQVAGRLQEAVRSADTVSRFAGDEFVILCESLSSEAEVALIADRILAAFQAPFQLGSDRVSVGCSVGVAASNAPAVSVDDLLRQADTAMYRAKMRGRGSWQQFDPSLGRPLAQRQDSDTVSLDSTVPADPPVSLEGAVTLDSATAREHLAAAEQVGRAAEADTRRARPTG